MSDTVLLDIDAGIARVTLNRPDAANGIDLEMAAALLDVAHTVKADANVRAVLLTGAGPRFCGGGDVRSFTGAPDLPRFLREVTTALHAALAIFDKLDAPIVSAVQGSAAGAGVGLVAMSDLAIAAQSCKFVMAYTGIGLTPDGSTTWYLPRLVGLRLATELTLTNRVLTADEARQVGLVTRVVADETLLTEAEALATQLAAGPTKAFGAAKRLLRASSTTSLEAQMAAESEAIARAGASDDGIEGIAAFVAKRAPTFRGR